MRLIAEVTDVYIVKGWLSFPRFKFVVEEADLTTCALNGRLSYWTGINNRIIRREASLFWRWGTPNFLLS